MILMGIISDLGTLGTIASLLALGIGAAVYMHTGFIKFVLGQMSRIVEAKLLQMKSDIGKDVGRELDNFVTWDVFNREIGHLKGAVDRIEKAVSSTKTNEMLVDIRKQITALNKRISK